MNVPAVCGALVAALLAPAAASAQGHLTTRMSASVSQVYDGNLFASAEPQADVMSRVGPSLEMNFRSLPLEIAGRYEIQAERYLNHPGLNTPASRQDALLAMRYTPRPRLDVTIDGGYLRTQTPAELNIATTGIGAGRAPAKRVGVNTGIRYQWRPTTTVTADYSVGHDAVAGGVSSTAQRWRAGLQHRARSRDSYRLEYQWRHTGFGGSLPMQSHAIVAGWDHALTPRTAFELAAGPRFTGGGSLRPEIAATLRRRLIRGELAINYSSTELTAIGERGTIDVHRAAITGRYRPFRRLDLSVTPSYIRSASGGAAVPVYALDAQSIVDVTRRIAVTGWTRIGRQRGTLSGSSAVIPYRGLGLTLRIAMTPAAAAASDSPLAKR